MPAWCDVMTGAAIHRLCLFNVALTENTLQRTVWCCCCNSTISRKVSIYLNLQEFHLSDHTVMSAAVDTFDTFFCKWARTFCSLCGNFRSLHQYTLCHVLFTKSSGSQACDLVELSGMMAGIGRHLTLLNPRNQHDNVPVLKPSCVVPYGFTLFCNVKRVTTTVRESVHTFRITV